MAPIRFVDPDRGGTKALLEEVKPYDRINRDSLEAYPPDTLFVVYCAGFHCNATENSAIRFARIGRPVKKMIGGVAGWLDEGFDLVKG